MDGLRPTPACDVFPGNTPRFSDYGGCQASSHGNHRPLRRGVDAGGAATDYEAEVRAARRVGALFGGQFAFRV